MNSCKTKLSDLTRNPAGIGLIGHVVVDYPDPQTFVDMVRVLDALGVTVIEVQIPFSEPIADGPVIMEACHQVIERGFNVERFFEVIEELRPQIKASLVAMTYLNIPFQMGYTNFAKRCLQVGVDGIIVADAPYDCGVFKAASEQGLAAIQVVPINVSSSRISPIVKACTGFVYVAARVGVTGNKSKLSDSLEALVSDIRDQTSLPIGVGFGVREKAQLDELSKFADYGIVGTASLQALHSGGLNGFKEFWQALGHHSERS